MSIYKSRILMYNIIPAESRFLGLVLRWTRTRITTKSAAQTKGTERQSNDVTSFLIWVSAALFLSEELRVKSEELRLILLDAKSSLTFAQANISSRSDITRRSRISLWAKPTMLCILHSAFCILHLIFSRVVVGADPYHRFAYLFITMYVSIAGRLKLTSKPKGLRLNSASMYVSLIGQ